MRVLEDVTPSGEKYKNNKGYDVIFTKWDEFFYQFFGHINLHFMTVRKKVEPKLCYICLGDAKY